MTSDDLYKQFSQLINKLDNFDSEERSSVINFLKNALFVAESSGLSDGGPSTSGPPSASPLSQSAGLDSRVNEGNLVPEKRLPRVAESYHPPCSPRVVPHSGHSEAEHCSKNSSVRNGNSAKQAQSTRLSNCMLLCPLCRLQFSTWPELEPHLYSAHNGTGSNDCQAVAPVCWRCQGVFANSALLLAHECFDWGRLHIPSQLTDVRSSRRRTLLCSQSIGKSFPTHGVFIKRRCGLCFRSTVIYSSHLSFLRHKSAAHSAADVDIASLFPTTTSSRCLQLAVNNEPNGCPVSGNHPASEEALRNTLRHVYHKLSQPSTRKQNRQSRPGENNMNQTGRRRRYVPPDTSGNSGSPTSDCCLTVTPPLSSCYGFEQMPAIRNDRLANSDLRRQMRNQPKGRRPVGNHSALVTVSAQLRNHSLRHGNRLLRRKQAVTRRSQLAGRRKRRLQSQSLLAMPTPATLQDHYHYYHYPLSRSCRRSLPLTCQRCPAVFRLTSSLRAHYLFQHGHIPTSLTGSTSSLYQQLNKDANQITAASIDPDPLADVEDTSLQNFTETAPRSPTIVAHPDDDSAASGGQSKTVSTESSSLACQICSKVYTTKGNLHRHISTTHAQDFRFFCGYCDYRTIERFAYDEHLARHFRVKQFSCEHCGARFTGRRELRDHVAFKHTAERKFQCTICGQAFKTSGTLWRHRTIHGERRLHTCTLCMAVFTRHCNLKRHWGRAHKQQIMHLNPPQNMVTVDLESGQVTQEFIDSAAVADHQNCQTSEDEEDTLPGYGETDIPSPILDNDSDEGAHLQVESSEHRSNHCQTPCSQVSISEFLSADTSGNFNHPTSEHSANLDDTLESVLISSSIQGKSEASIGGCLNSGETVQNRCTQINTESHPVSVISVTPATDDDLPHSDGVTTVFLLNLADLDSVPSLLDSNVAMASVANNAANGMTFTDMHSPMFEAVGERSISDGFHPSATVSTFASLFPLQPIRAVSPELASGMVSHQLASSTAGWSSVTGQTNPHHQEQKTEFSPSSQTLQSAQDKNLCYLVTSDAFESTASSDTYPLAEVVQLHDASMQNLQIPVSGIPLVGTASHVDGSDDDHYLTSKNMHLDDGGDVASASEDIICKVDRSTSTRTHFLPSIFDSTLEVSEERTIAANDGGGDLKSHGSTVCTNTTECMWGRAKVFTIVADLPATTGTASTHGCYHQVCDTSMSPLVTTAPGYSDECSMFTFSLRSTSSNDAVVSPSSLFHSSVSSSAVVNPVSSDVSPVATAFIDTRHESEHFHLASLTHLTNQHAWRDKECLHFNSLPSDATLPASTSSFGGQHNCGCQQAALSFLPTSQAGVGDCQSSDNHYQQCCVSNFSVGYLIGQRIDNDDDGCLKSAEVMPDPLSHAGFHGETEDSYQ